MDLSKLPKLSQTDAEKPASPQIPMANEPAPARQVIPYAPLDATNSAAQIWLSSIVGIILMLVARSFPQFVIAKLLGHPFHTGVIWQSGDLAGQEVDYFQLQGYTAWSDAAVFLFGLAMILEAVVMALVRRNTPATRALLIAALLITLAVTTFNLIVAGMLLHLGVIPLLSAIAVAYGGFVAIYEWQLIRRFQAEARA